MELRDTTQLRWTAARKAADRISRICSAAAFVEPGDATEHHAKRVLIAGEINVIVGALLLTTTGATP